MDILKHDEETTVTYTISKPESTIIVVVYKNIDGLKYDIKIHKSSNHQPLPQTFLDFCSEIESGGEIINQ